MGRDGMTLEGRIRMAEEGVCIADRCVCHECGMECDLGDCDFDDEGELRCPFCGEKMEEIA